MSFPVVLGSKSVSSRPLVAAASSEAHTDEHDYSFLAEDGMTPLDPICVPGAPLAATAVCPLQEWLATLTIRYYDMIMAVDDDDDDDDDESDDESDEQDSSQEDLKAPLISGRRRKLARHSTVAEVRIQVSPLSLPFSSAYQEVCHRLTLPNLPPMMMATNSSTPKATPAACHTDSGYMREDHLEHFADQIPVKPCLVFSSDRQRLACLIPYPRGPHSVLVAFTLSRPTQQFAPPPRPKLPSYIPTGTTSTHAAAKQRPVPQALHDPEWLQLPTNASLDIRDSAAYWLRNITSICRCNITPGSTSTAELYGASKGRSHPRSSVLLAGCRDGSILGVSFHPLLLAGRLYYPHATNNFSNDGKGKSDHITFLSHITTSFGASGNEEDAKKADVTGPPPPHSPMERDVLGKLVVIRESGRALIFQTRMILSSLTHHENEDRGYEYYDPDESTSASLYQHEHNMDATDNSDTETDYAVQAEASGFMMIHAESFHVVKTGRRNSLPANTRFSKEQDPLHRHPNNISNGAPHQNKNPYSNAIGNTGLLMFVELLCEYGAGNLCRARWITGSLLAVLERPKQTRVEMNETTSNNTAPRNRVAQVLAIIPGRPPEPLSELTLTSEDLIESPHTTFSVVEQEDDTKIRYGGGTSIHITPPYSLLLARDASASLLEASLGLDYDSCTGCIAINSVRIVSDPSTSSRNSDGKTKSTNSMQDSRVLVFANLWCWKTNTLGFTAVAKFSFDSNLHRPISRLLFTRERLTNVRQLVHLHSVGRLFGGNRVRKDLYQLGLMSPPQNVYIKCGLDLKETAPIILSPSSVAYASVSHPSGQTSELEWRESNVPVSYRLAYGAPLIAAMSAGGRSIAVASARGLCVLECSPRAKKISVARERCYLQRSSNSHPEGGTQSTGVGYRLPPKWHLFGNECEEKAFRVLAMTWWQGNQLASRNHLSGDLLVAVIQLQKQNESGTDPKGTCYLACWSERRLDTAHQRLRPLEEPLQASRCEWGVRLPRAFRVKSLHVLSQPASFSCGESPTSNSKQIERKAVVLLSSITEQSGVTEFLVYQFQVIPSVGRSQSSDSYAEHNPFSVLSKQCSSGVMRAKGVGDSTSSVFLASASFQFDLRQRKSRISRDEMSPSSDPEVGDVNAIVGTIGLIKSPGGLDAVVITSKGPSLVLSIFSTNKTEQGQGKPMKSSEISSFCLSDVLLAQRSIATTYGENAMLDFYVWTIQLADGKIHSWFVPCLEFPSECNPGKRSPNVFSSRVMLGMVCPAGNASTWLQPTPAKSGRSFMIGCVPHSPHGCFLSTGQASRKFHRTIAGDFDNSLFAGDFMEHEYLYPKDVEIYPPAFISSIAALLQSSSSLLLANASEFSATHNTILNAGGDDVKTALLAINTSDHMRIRSKQHQDATFLAFRLLILRSVEQYTDDLRKGRGELAASVLAELLHVVQSCTSGRLQFASLILEVGRQLEPSCFPQLFPLPVPQRRVEGKQRDTTKSMAPPIIRTRWQSAINLVTVDDFFIACSRDGSLLVALSSLPILAEGELSRQKSGLLLDHCLRIFEENGKSEKDIFYDFSLDERSALGDIFRFGVKLEDNANEDVVDFDPDEIFHPDEASTNSSSSSSSRSIQSEDGHDNRRKGYSMACGMFNFSWFSRGKSATTLPQQQSKTSASKKTGVPLEEVGAIERDQEANRVSKVHNGDHDSRPTTSSNKVAQSVATLLLQVTISNKDGQLARAYGWKRAAALASLLLGQGESMMSKISAKECTSLAKSAGEFRVGNVPYSRSLSLEEDLSDMLTRCIVACSTEIGVRSAGRILDLVLILLSRCKHSTDCDAILPSLLLIGIAVGHISGRIEEILDVQDKSITFARCYLKAKVKADSLFAC